METWCTCGHSATWHQPDRWAECDVDGCECNQFAFDHEDDDAGE